MPRLDALTRPEPYWTDGNCTLYHGDCLMMLPRLTASTIDLIFCDPPFNIGHKYDEYKDDKSKKDYLTWSKVWLTLCWRLLKRGGSMWVAIGPTLQAEVKLVMEASGFTWQDTIIWHYTFGPRQETKLTPSWVALHHFTKGPAKTTWNKDAIRVPSARQLKYRDARAQLNGKLPDNVWVLLPEECEECFRPDGNTWLASRVCGTFKERTSHPAQMPLAILDRIIKLCTNEGDVVLDPMVGSGTTLAAAKQLNRRGVGIELSEGYLRDCCIPRLE